VTAPQSGVRHEGRLARIAETASISDTTLVLQQENSFATRDSTMSFRYLTERRAS